MRHSSCDFHFFPPAASGTIPTPSMRTSTDRPPMMNGFPSPSTTASVVSGGPPVRSSVTPGAGAGPLGPPPQAMTHARKAIEERARTTRCMDISAIVVDYPETTAESPELAGNGGRLRKVRNQYDNRSTLEM